AAWLAVCCGAQTAKPRTTKAPAPAPAIGTGHSGEELWRAVPVNPMQFHMAEAELTPVQLGQINQTLVERAEADGWGCEDDVPADDWIKELTYWKFPLTPTVPAIFIEA